ncbi:MAG: integrase core domain-containing protein [Candidatus Acidiferrales bacterium]
MLTWRSHATCCVIVIARRQFERFRGCSTCQIKVWTAEYCSLEEARTSIACWIEEYNHDRPHRGVQNRTPHEAFLSFAVDLKNEALTV